MTFLGSQEVASLQEMIAARTQVQMRLCVHHTLWCHSLLKSLTWQLAMLRADPNNINPCAADIIARYYRQMWMQEALIAYGFREQQRMQEILQKLQLMRRLIDAQEQSNQMTERIGKRKPKKRNWPIIPAILVVCTLALLVFMFMIGLPVGG